MNKLHKQRLILVSIALVGLSIAAGLLLYAFSDNMNAFLTPTTLLQHPTTRNITLGGLVKPHSLHHEKNNIRISFEITDGKHDIQVIYDGIAPDLFREGKGVIANGRLLANGVFSADQLLAKHDETYTPPKNMP